MRVVPIKTWLLTAGILAFAAHASAQEVKIALVDVDQAINATDQVTGASGNRRPC